MFRFGEAAGSIVGLLVGLGIRLTFVTPQAWQRHHGVGPSPDAARQRVVQLYPGIADRFCMKRASNLADALLIAEYGRRSLLVAASVAADN